MVVLNALVNLACIVLYAYLSLTAPCEACAKDRSECPPEADGVNPTTKTHGDCDDPCSQLNEDLYSFYPESTKQEPCLPRGDNFTGYTSGYPSAETQLYDDIDCNQEPLNDCEWPSKPKNFKGFWTDPMPDGPQMKSSTYRQLASSVPFFILYSVFIFYS